MTSKQTVVMWSGIILVILRFFTTSQFAILWSDIIAGNDPGKILGKVPESTLRQYGLRGPNSGTVMGGPLNSNGSSGSGYLQA